MGIILTSVAKSICRSAPGATRIIRHALGDPEGAAALRYVVATVLAAALYEDRGHAQIGRHAAR